MSSGFFDVNLPFYFCLLDIQLKDGGNKLKPVRDTNLKTLLCAEITLSTHKLHFEHWFRMSVIPVTEFPSSSQNQRQMQTTSPQLQTVYGRENAICFHSTGKKNKKGRGGGGSFTWLILLCSAHKTFKSRETGIYKANTAEWVPQVPGVLSGTGRGREGEEGQERCLEFSLSLRAENSSLCRCLLSPAVCS